MPTKAMLTTNPTLKIYSVQLKFFLEVFASPLNFRKCGATRIKGYPPANLNISGEVLSEFQHPWQQSAYRKESWSLKPASLSSPPKQSIYGLPLPRLIPCFRYSVCPGGIEKKWEHWKHKWVVEI